MGSFTTEYAHTILDQLETDAPRLALFTASPGDGGSATDEVSATNYAREDISTAFEDAGATTDREKSNDVEIAFVQADNNWGTISHIAFCAGATIGTADLKIWGALTTSKTIESGDQLVFSSGNITISVAAG